MEVARSDHVNDVRGKASCMHTMKSQGRSGDIGPLNFNVGTRWERAVGFTPWATLSVE
jgi:hypothetical protein